MKIIIYGIAKDESKLLPRFIDTTKKADKVIIVDTGSTDDTVKILKENGIEVYEKTFTPFRFDEARNFALSKIPEDYDVAIAMDIDDVLVDDWREIVESSWELGKTTTLRYKYVYAWQDELQTIPRLTQWGFKIHCPKAYKWFYPIHEITDVKDKSIIENIKTIDKRIIVHYPDLTKEERLSRIKIFEENMKDYSTDDRMVHLYGRELYFNNKNEEAIKVLKDYLELTANHYEMDAIKQTRSFTCRLIASMLETDKKDYAEILPWYLQSVSEYPFQREPWLHLGYCWYKIGDGLSAYAAVKKGLLMTNEEISIESEGKSWDIQAHFLLKKCEELMNKQKYINKFSGEITDIELNKLLELSKDMASVLEVGCLEGKSIQAFCTSCLGYVYGIDNKKDDLFISKMKEFPNFQFINESSESAADYFEKESIDLIYIDADYSFEEVRRNIDMWYGKAKKILCGYGYDKEGVKKAIDRMFPDAKIFNNIWVIEKVI